MTTVSAWRLVALTAAAGCARTPGPRTPSFSLEEIRSHALAPGVSVRAIALSPRGWLMVAPEGDRLTLIDPDGKERTLRITVSERLLGLRLGPCDSCASALMNEDTALVEIDGHSGRAVARWTPGAARLRRWTSAVPSASPAWYVAANDPTGGWRVFSLAATGPVSELADLREHASGDVSDSSIIQSVRLAPARDGVIAAMSGRPHQAFVLDSAGKIAAILRPSTPKHSIGDGSVDRTWIGLGVFDIGSGYLQVLANPGSDERLLVLFDGRGKELRSSALHAPWGPAAVLTDPPWLVALRNANPPEIVIYRWRWTDSAGKTLTP